MQKRFQPNDEPLPEVNYCIMFKFGTVANTTNFANLLKARKIIQEEYPDMEPDSVIEAYVL